MATTEKDTIYVDIDDEITTIIDKVRSSDGRIVALVLPKRATVFQSIVNMKLLKRAADTAKKRIVLITTEANLMPLAGTVGLHVAATPQSRPEIPTAVEPAHAMDLDEEEVADGEYTADNAGDRSIGELSQRSGHAVPAVASDAVNLDDEEDEVAEEEGVRSKRDRKLSVPNFNRFRMWLVLAVFGAVVLGIGLYFALVVMPKAAIAISTNTSSVNVNLNLALDTSAQKLDSAKLTVPAKSEQQQKTSSQQVATTGQKNTGQTAAGTVTMTAQACAPNLNTPPDPVPAGTGISTNGLTFITDQKATFNFDTFTSGSCARYKTSSVDVTAQNAGTKYNVTNATFTVAGRSGVSANGTANGGTDSIIHIVAQTDIDSAKQKLATQDSEAIKSSLEQALRTDGMYPLAATFNAGDPIVTTSANAGDTADNVTVTQAVTYTMLGVKKADLDTLITNSVSKQIDSKDQTISNDGLDQLSATIGNTSGTTTQLTLQTTATVGPSIDPGSIKKQAAGKKIGDVKSMVNSIPGVTSVDVRLSPFWVSAVPSDPSKVTVTISKAK